MKTKNNKITKILGAIFAALLLAGMYSCDDKVNDWDTDSSYDKLFRPLGFERMALTANSVDISFTKVVGADKYIFEISQDSLEFNIIERTVEVATDTLKPYSASTVATRILYKESIADLDANTQYSVRMKAINKDGSVQSEYVQLVFRTPEENIFTKNYDVSNDQITIKWTPTNRVTTMDVIEDATSTPILSGYELSATDKADAKKTVAGLKMGTYYTFIIYNEGKERGRISAKTTGTLGSESYQVQETDDLSTVLYTLLGEGKTNVTLIFKNGTEYSIGELVVPAGMVSLTFSAPSGVMPTLNLKKVTLTTSMDALFFENVKLTGAGAAETSSRILDTNQSVQTISFINCYISDYNCVIRLQNSSLTVEKFW